MVFNSISFFVFFVIVFCLYYALPKGKAKWQNILLLVSSYFFYGYADWRMLPLLLITTVLFYFLGIQIEKGSEKKASILTNIGVILGIGILLYFKYLNFFIESFAKMFEGLGFNSNLHSFNIIMPIGISFFTFKLISYIVEIHRGKLEASRNIVDFATYISFFPCILSGPIDRPKDFLPQLQQRRNFDYNTLNEGVMQFAWGCFQKVVIADNCARVVDSVWGSLEFQSGGTLLFTTFLYLFQVFADFAGYSDMAIGVGKLLGIKITKNFNHPLFALNIADYWRKWHISLTSWLTDYVFMPLNIKFRNLGNFGIILAIIINMVLIGFWHGADWTFGLFGLYHGLLYVPLVLSGAFFKKTKMKVTRLGLPTASNFLKMLMTIILVSFGLIIFRAENISEMCLYLSRLFSASILSIPSFAGDVNTCAILSCIFILFLIIFEWRSRKQDFFLQNSNNIIVRCLFLTFYVITIYYLGEDSNAFIYFQF